MIEEIEVDPPKAFEIRIKILCTSLCHTDVTFRKMNTVSFPSIKLVSLNSFQSFKWNLLHFLFRVLLQFFQEFLGMKLLGNLTPATLLSISFFIIDTSLFICVGFGFLFLFLVW